MGKNSHLPEEMAGNQRASEGVDVTSQDRVTLTQHGYAISVLVEGTQQVGHEGAEYRNPEVGNSSR